MLLHRFRSRLIVDWLPPEPPSELAGTIDTNGIVRLHWRRSPEQTILDTGILWANSITEDSLSELL